MNENAKALKFEAARLGGAIGCARTASALHAETRGE